MSTVSRIVRLACVAALAIALAGCVQYNDSTATFVRYETLPDGTSVAVVELGAVGASAPQETAFTSYDDLHPGEIVTVREIGRDWDEPQWTPTAYILQREDPD